MVYVSEAIQRMREAGIKLVASDGQLKVSGKKPLTDDQRQFIRQHKDRIISELATPPEIREAARRKINCALRLLGDDALDWLVEDLGVVAQMSTTEVETILLDYLSKREWYRRGLWEDSKMEPERS